MAKIYKGQPFTILIDTGQTLSGGSAPLVYYKKPSGTTGEVVATVTDTTKLSGAILGATNDESGVWYFQGKYTFSGDAAGTYTETHNEIIYAPIK
jgi:hypothetical protein